MFVTNGRGKKEGFSYLGEKEEEVNIKKKREMIEITV